MIDAFLDAPLANGLGLLGTLCAIAWPMFRKRTGMLAAQAAIGLLFGLHYAMLGAHTGALMNTLAMFQALAAIPLGDRPGFRRIYLFTLPLIAAGLVLTWTGWASAFAAAGMAILSLARYQLDHVRLRAIVALSIPFWFVHNVMVGSIPAIASDLLSTAINLYNLRRDLRDRRAAALAPAAG